jgi:hypothetical protein
MNWSAHDHRAYAELETAGHNDRATASRNQAGHNDRALERHERAGRGKSGAAGAAGLIATDS